MRRTGPEGRRIAWETVGSGPPLVLLHGSFGDRGTWWPGGHVGALAGEHRLVLIDAIGHGESDAPDDPAAYRIDRQAGDVLAVLDAEGAGRAAFWGASMGGTIGFHLLARHPERLTCLIASGAHARGLGADPADVEREAAFCRDRGAAPFVEAVERRGALPGWMRDAMLAIAPEALAAQTVGLFELPDVTAAVAEAEVPVLLLAGDGDHRLPAIRRTAEAVPKASLLELPGCGHLDAFLRLDLTLPVVRPFLRRYATA
ncbi:alpha/beta fold hydrolase [Actinomadura verrucosospora]|uniref:Alpha/beta hydrolase fold protein n=1 Tax=Actinomadura verrucosospora TaxID=46165 RepID=A0A7D3ZSP0_ACTVE|nr:alpha/beta hydrolase [Actinomadura verrucosospora]QKG26743.1 alpha/beta hydrolase fold protein [Actinomadura verrucosospora]